MPTAATELARAGKHVVTLGDYEEATRWSLLFSPTPITQMPPERMAIPHIHLTMTRALLMRKVVTAEVARRGMKISDDDVRGFIAAHDKLSRFALFDDPAALKAALDPYGLTVADLMMIGRLELERIRLEEALLQEIPEDEIWQTYAVQTTTVTAAVVAVDNVPTSEEIDNWMAANPDRIDEHYRKNSNKYRIPKRVRLNIVRPAPGKTADEAAMKRAAQMLGEGIQPVTVAKNLGLEFELDVSVVRPENARAFAQSPGEVGFVLDGPRGAHAWKVVGFVDSRLQEMDRALRREIAAELLRTTQLTPSCLDRLRAATKILEATKIRDGGDPAYADLETELKQIPKSTFVVGTFPKSPLGSIPGFGLAEEALDAVFAAKVGEVHEPVLSRDRGFVAKVLQRHDATKREFRENLDGNRQAYVDAIRPRIVQMRAEGTLQGLGATIDTKPLRIKYGVLKKQ